MEKLLPPEWGCERMFLRKRGRRVLLLHSYRDGQGRVCQARLGHFEEVDEARRCLRSSQWREDFARRFPEVKVDWSRVSEQAREIPKNSTTRPRARPLKVRLEEAFSTFLRLLAQADDPQLTQQIADVVRDRLRLAETQIPEDCLEKGDESQLEALEWRARAQLEPRRSDFQDGQASLYLKTLARRAEILQAEGRPAEACQVLEELTRSQPSDDHRADYAAALQALGRTEEASQEYQRIPRDSAVRYYNLATIDCKNGHMDKALGHLMKGMLRDSGIARAEKDRREGRQPVGGQDYWQKFGHLWDPIGRWFLLATYSQVLVRSRLTRAAEDRVRPRELVTGKARQLLLQRVLHWTPPKAQVVARRKRSRTASQSGP